MPYAYLDDIALEVTDQGSGPPLVFVHGFPLDRRLWARQVEAFCDRHRVLAVDLRGCGGSKPAPPTASMSLLADDLDKMLAARDVREPITYCGLSMGGYVGWEFWRRHRRRVARLALCDTRSAADGEQAAAARRAMADRVLAEGVGFVAEQMVPRLLAPATLQSAPAVVEAVRRMILETEPAAVAALQRGMAGRADASPLLASIDVPALCIVGEHDAITPPAEMRVLAERLPHGQCAVIPAAGHLPPLENPKAFNDALAEFLDRT